MAVNDEVKISGLRLQRTIDSANHLQFYVWVT